MPNRRISELTPSTGLQANDRFVIETGGSNESISGQLILDFVSGNIDIPVGIADIEGLQVALDGKADVVHTHQISDVSGLRTELDTKFDATTAGISGRTVIIGANSIVIPSELGGVSDDRIPSSVTVGNYPRFSATTGQLEERTIDQFRQDLMVNNVDNTSDLNKPISTATQTALDGKANTGDVFSGNYSDLTGAPTTITTAQANAITANTAKNTYPSADATKLAGIEVGADRTDTANVFSSLGVNTSTGSTTSVLTQRGVFVNIPDRVLQVTALDRKPISYNNITGDLNVGIVLGNVLLDDGSLNDAFSITLDVSIEELLSEIIQPGDITTLTFTNATGTVFNANSIIASTGFQRLSVATSNSNTIFLFIFDTIANAQTAQSDAATDLPRGEYTLNFTYQENNEGGFADVANSLYVRGGGDFVGELESDILRARGCVELFNRATNVWYPANPTSGTDLGLTTTDIVVNSVTGDSSGLGGLTASVPNFYTSDPTGEYVYFGGYERAGVFRISATDVGGGTFTFALFNWAGGNSDSFSQTGAQEIIPAGTTLYQVADSSDFELQSHDATLGLIAEPDLIQMHANNIRMIDVPTVTGEGTILAIDQHQRVRRIAVEELDFSNVPTTAPTTSGRIWNNGGVLTITP